MSSIILADVTSQLLGVVFGEAPPEQFRPPPSSRPPTRTGQFHSNLPPTSGYLRLLSHWNIAIQLSFQDDLFTFDSGDRH